MQPVLAFPFNDPVRACLGNRLQNYREIEGIVTTVGRNLFGKELDYAWCHIVVRAGQLHEIIPFVKNPNLSMVAEMIFYLQDKIETRDVKLYL